MKKLIALLLCLAMLASVLAGCGPAQNEETQPPEAKIGKKAPAGHTVTIGVPGHAMVEDWENNAFTKWLEQESGYNIEIVKYGFDEGSYKAQVATEFQVPGVKMPDMLWGMHLGLQAIEDYGTGGYIMDLSPYFESEEYSADWWALLNEIEDKNFVEWAKRKMYADDCKAVYAFPFIEYCTYDMIRHQAYINQEWLDKLNLPMPTNTEELYNTLVAFKNQDPNGNGKKDEIPLIGKAGGLYGDVVSWLVNMFCYMEDARPLKVDKDGKISGNFWSDEYRQALIFINKLVKEDLMPDSVFTLSGGDITSLVNPADGVETVGIFLGHPAGTILEGSDAVNIYKAVPQWGYVVMDTGNAYMNTTITSSCEYPDACWEILMLMSSKEGSYRMRYGEKGVDWVDATPGTKSFTGQDAEIKVINMNILGGAHSQSWNQISACVSQANENERSELSDDLDPFVKAKLILMGECWKYHWTRYEEQGGLPEGFIMPLVYTTDEEEEGSSWRGNTLSWFKTARANFIKGTGELNDPADNAQWQKYIDGFKANNYYDWMELAQDVYDAMLREEAAK